MRAVEVVIHGRVQGVGFRWSASRVACDLGLSGWVQNASDGTVEARLVASNSAVEKMLAWCQESPPSSHVTSVDQQEADPASAHELREFEIR